MTLRKACALRIMNSVQGRETPSGGASMAVHTKVEALLPP